MSTPDPQFFSFRSKGCDYVAPLDAQGVTHIALPNKNVLHVLEWEDGLPAHHTEVEHVSGAFRDIPSAMYAHEVQAPAQQQAAVA